MINPIVLARVYCTIIYIYIKSSHSPFFNSISKTGYFRSIFILLFIYRDNSFSKHRAIFFHYSTQNRNRNESKGFQLKESSVKHFLRTFQFLIIFAKSLRSIYTGKILRSLVIIITLLLEQTTPLQFHHGNGKRVYAFSHSKNRATNERNIWIYPPFFKLKFRRGKRNGNCSKLRVSAPARKLAEVCICFPKFRQVSLERRWWMIPPPPTIALEAAS